MRKKGNSRAAFKTSIWTVNDEGNHSPREAAALGDDDEAKQYAGPSTGKIKAMVEARDNHKLVRARAEEAHRIEIQHAAATKIQSWFRMCRHAKFGGLAFLWRKRMHVQNNAVLVLQRVYRGHLARHSEDFRLRLEFRRLEHNCAIHIQAVTRGHLDRRAVRDALQKAEDDRVRRAVTIIQRYARGYRVRKLNNRARTILRAKVLIIENFHIKYFQPWHAKQMDILQDSLQKIVVVQSRVRRFLAIAHSKHLKRARSRNFANGISMLLYAVMMLLFMTATINERSNGDFSDAARATQHHLHPAPPSHHLPPSWLQDHHFPPSVVAHPNQFWEWLESSYLPRYRSMGATPACNEVQSTSRLCAPSTNDRFPGHVVRQLIVRQKRSRLTRMPLPFANSNDVDQVCTAATTLHGSVCRRYDPPEVPSTFASSETPPPQTTPAPADPNATAPEAAEQEPAASEGGAAGGASLRGEGTVWGGLRFSGGWEDKGEYGSRFSPFSYQGSVDGESTTGEFGWYGDGGYLLAAGGERLAVESEAATSCTVPCEGGLRRFALTGWLDSRTRAVVLLAATVLEQVNALVLSKTVVEFSAGGAVHATTQVDGTRWWAYGGGGGNWWRGAEAEGGGRIAAEVLLFVGGVVHFGWVLLTALMRIEATLKEGRLRVRMKRKSGSSAHRIYGVLRGWVLLDILLLALLLLALLLRGAAQGEARRMFAATGEAVAKDGGSVKVWSIAEDGDGGVGWKSLRNLSNIHKAGDGVVGLAGVVFWARAVVLFLPMVPAAKALPAALARAAMPLFSVMLVVVPVLVCVLHVTLLLASTEDVRVASSVLAARTHLDSLLRMLALEESWDALPARGRADLAGRAGDRGWHRAGSALRQPTVRGGEADGLLVGVWGVLGLVCAGLVGAVVLEAVAVELEVEKDRRHRPWLYPDGRGDDQYQPWSFPPLVELRRALRKALETRRQQRAETARVRTQARQVRTSRRRIPKRPFQWELLKEEDEAAKIQRQTMSELRAVSRQLAWQEREMVAWTDRVCDVMEDGADDLLELTTALFNSHFESAQLLWPNAVLSPDQLVDAARRRDEAEEARKQQILKVPRKRFEALDKQLRGVEQQLSKLVDHAAMSMSAVHHE